MIKRLVIVTILLLFPVTLFAANLLFSENFDDQVVDGTDHGSALPFGSIDTTTGTPDTYVMTRTGRGGSGYAMSQEKLNWAQMTDSGDDMWDATGTNNEYISAFNSDRLAQDTAGRSLGQMPGRGLCA